MTPLQQNCTATVPVHAISEARPSLEMVESSTDLAIDTGVAAPRMYSLPKALPFGLLEAYAVRLAQFYRKFQDGQDEHPVYTKYDWRLEAESSGQSNRGYWAWVATNIERDQAMWPWDCEAAPSVLVARAAGVSVGQIPGKGWEVQGSLAAAIEDLSFASEFEAWRAGARAVLDSPEVRNGHSRAELESMPLTVLTHWISVCSPKQPDQAQESGLTGAMSEIERVGSHWVKVAHSAGLAVQMSAPHDWSLANGPDVPTVDRAASYPTEAAAWRAAAAGLLEHLRLHLECQEDLWRAKSPGQHLELVKTFYADCRPATPDFAFTQHHVHLAKVLCQNIGWRVNKIRDEQGHGCKGWQLNRKGHYFAEADAWLAGADAIRREVMKRAQLSYLQWLKLSLDEQISLGLTHVRC